eukprot:3941906-Prymnesium_polylepis.1
MTSPVRVLQGYRVAGLSQDSKPATPHGRARTSGGLGAPRGTTRASDPPLLGRAHGSRAILALYGHFRPKSGDVVLAI